MKLLVCAAACLAAAAPAAAAGPSFDGTAARPDSPAPLVFSRGASRAAGPAVGASARALSLGQDRLELLVDGDAFSRATLDAIRGARVSLDLEMFDFENESFIAALCDQARRVRVRVVLDPFEGHTPAEIAHKRAMVARIRAAGADVAFYPTRRLHGAVFKIDHVKLLIADGRAAVAGGSNWLKDPGENHDYNLRLEGPVVGRLREAFAQSWALAHGLPAPPRRTPSLDPGRGVEVLLTDASHEEPLQALLHQISRARRIRAEELLLDERRVVDALIAARRRGADIELVLDPNRFFFGGVNAETAQELRDAGIAVRFFRDPAGRQTLLHAKMAVFDGQTVLLGSANWSRNALEVNHELALLFRDVEVGRALEGVIAEDWSGRSAAPRDRHGLARLLQRFVAGLAGLFS